MGASTQSKAAAKEHASAIIAAAQFFQAAAKRGELPLTETEFEERVKEFFASLESKLDSSNALMLAILSDEPCPQSLFEAWAGAKAVWRWRNAGKDLLPSVLLNGKVMIKPTDFFAALKIHGKEMG